MISNQILQSTIDGLKAITRVEVCVMDTEGNVVAGTYAGNGEYQNVIRSFVKSPNDSQVAQGCHFFKVYDEHHLEYILLVHGIGEDISTIGKLAVFQLQGLLVAYKERFDKDNFIKSLLLDNLLLVDIYNRAKKLYIDTDVKRVIFIIEVLSEKDVNILDRVRNLFGDKNKDFVTAVDERNVIVVKID